MRREPERDLVVQLARREIANCTSAGPAWSLRITAGLPSDAHDESLRSPAQSLLGRREISGRPSYMEAFILLVRMEAAAPL
jgi:hypothetical protein